MGTARWLPPGVNVAELKRHERELEERLRVVRKLLGTLDETAVTGGRKRRRRAHTRLTQIVEVLKEAGDPLSIQAIYARLQEKDPGVSWKQPAAAFRSYLRSQEEGIDMVVRVGRGVYGLKAWEDQPPDKDDTPTDDSENIPGPWDD